MAIQKDKESFDKIHLHLGLSEEWQLEPGPEAVCELAKPTQNITRYAQAKTDDQVLLARKSSVPEKTQQDTKWCVRLWDEWAEHRNSQMPDKQIATPITAIPLGDLSYWLERFVLEIRKRDGSEYVPATLHHIVCGIMRHLRETDPTIDVFNDPTFTHFRKTLDGEMKRIRSTGTGTKKKQAELITEEEEEQLWSTGTLGDHSPIALLNTIFYMCGIYFALRSGQEHRQLRYQPCQIEVIENPGKRAYLLYTEDVSKNNQGGLKGRKIIPKSVRHYANEDNPTRCFVRLFKLYNSLCPKNRPADALYLKPLINKKDGCWFAAQALGHNTLSTMVQKMCQNAGIVGYKTNHSLRATTASRLFHNGVDEQLIMERTGHHSLDGIRSYKRTSTDQVIALSDILNAPHTKKRKEEITKQPDSHHVPKIQFNNCSSINIVVNNA